MALYLSVVVPGKCASTEDRGREPSSSVSISTGWQVQGAIRTVDKIDVVAPLVATPSQ